MTHVPIMLIDDDFTFYEIFRHQVRYALNDQDVEIEYYNNAVNALECLKKRPAVVQYIFIDINLPVMNGWEFLSKIKDNYDLISKVKLFMITGSPFEYQEYQKVSYDFIEDFLHKPITREQLTELLGDQQERIAS